MKNLIYFSFLLISLGSCKKAIDNAKEDAVIDIMVDGQWYITKYLKANIDVTNDFTGYKFQFFENRTVDAIKNNAVQKTGTWQGNATALTIYSNFANADYPLSLVNGTFQITDSSPSFVEANTTVNGEYRWLRLEK
jgi:membrane protease subunit (stomatin/prohibitin family)